MRIAIILAITATAAIAHADEAADVKACNGGNAGKCEELSERYLDGSGGTAKDPLKSIAFLERACTLNAGRACNNAGTRWSEGKDGAPAVEHGKARQFYEKACKLKNGLGCFNFGNVYRIGEGVTIDLKIAFTNFTKSCDLNEAKGCTELGILYYEGKAVAKDVKKAIALFEKSCKLGSQAACKNLEILKKANP
jgi:uncharacterized protein